MATASYTAPTKLNAGKLRRLGQQPGERSESSRPIELQRGVTVASTTKKFEGTAIIAHVYSQESHSFGWLLLHQGNKRYIVRVEYVVAVGRAKPKNPVRRPEPKVSPVSPVTVDSGLNTDTCKALTLPAFQLHEYVEYPPAHIGRIERIAGGLYWVANERTPYLAHQLTRLTPDPDVCPSCIGTGDCGDTRVDSLNNLKDYPCPVCGGKGKKV